MERKPARYRIPIGTSVEIRDTVNNGKVRQYVTQKELTFSDRSGTGYNSRIYYFMFEGWCIAVNADLVE